MSYGQTSGRTRKVREHLPGRGYKQNVFMSTVIEFYLILQLINIGKMPVPSQEYDSCYPFV